MNKLQQMFINAVNDTGSSYSWLAHKAGMSRQHVFKMMHGEIRGSMESWEKLLDAAGITIGWRYRRQGEARTSDLAWGQHRALREVQGREG